MNYNLFPGEKKQLGKAEKPTESANKYLRTFYFLFRGLESSREDSFRN
jgi:hypothetical protein